MINENLKPRTKTFALAIIKLAEALPAGRICNALGDQLLRTGTSVGANYRAACRAKSPADFNSKIHPATSTRPAPHSALRAPRS